MSAGLAASTVTPGRIAPVVSFTTPANALCACALVGSASTTAKAHTAHNILLIMPNLLQSRNRTKTGRFLARSAGRYAELQHESTGWRAIRPFFVQPTGNLDLRACG